MEQDDADSQKNITGAKKQHLNPKNDLTASHRMGSHVAVLNTVRSKLHD